MMRLWFEAIRGAVPTHLQWCQTLCDELWWNGEYCVYSIPLLMPTTMPAWSYWVWGVMCWIGLMILWALTSNLLDPEAGSFQGCCNENGCVPPDLLCKFPAFHWLLKELTCKLDRVPEEVPSPSIFFFSLARCALPFKVWQTFLWSRPSKMSCVPLKYYSYPSGHMPSSGMALSAVILMLQYWYADWI